MSLLFRVDASTDMGAGHVMRCLTLADALRKHGAGSAFVCRAHAGHLGEVIQARGHDLHLLDVDSAPDDDSGLAHAAWLGSSQAQDADACAAIAARIQPDWLIVDHYALDARWEAVLRPVVGRTMVIDDLADRRHDCDLLLDQNLGRCAADYRDLTPPASDALVGPRFALLRPEFAALRAESLVRREDPQLKHLLVTMGGIDGNDVTGAVLRALNTCDLPPDLRITVVLASQAPWLEQVQAQVATMRRPTSVLSGVSNMARLMTDADLAVGAAGGTSWERCCLGLPTIQFVLAENQKQVAGALAERDAAILFPDEMGLRDGLAMLLAQLSPERLRALAEHSAEICDGHGAMAVVNYMTRQMTSSGTRM